MKLIHTLDEVDVTTMRWPHQKDPGVEVRVIPSRLGAVDAIGIMLVGWVVSVDYCRQRQLL